MAQQIDVGPPDARRVLVAIRGRERPAARPKRAEGRAQAAVLRLTGPLLGGLAQGLPGGGDAPAADLAGPVVEPVVGSPLLDEDQLSFHGTECARGV